MTFLEGPQADELSVGLVTIAVWCFVILVTFQLVDYLIGGGY